MFLPSGFSQHAASGLPIVGVSIRRRNCKTPRHGTSDVGKSSDTLRVRAEGQAEMASCVTEARQVKFDPAVGNSARKADGMLRVRTYEGNADELSRFVGSVWRATYAGKMPLPIWDAAYFDW